MNVGGQIEVWSDSVTISAWFDAFDYSFTLFLDCQQASPLFLFVFLCVSL